MPKRLGRAVVSGLNCSSLGWTAHMNVFSRTYWDFFVGAGLFVGLFLLFAALLAWQLGCLNQQTLGLMSLVTWALAILFVGITLLSWMYLFIVPVILSAAITSYLITAAW